MIEQVYINGYKSLVDFRMSIRPGINVLVGENGVGKSNILSFFQLLGNLVPYEVGDAINMSGGVGRVFQKKSDKDYVDRLNFTISGTCLNGEDEYAYEYSVNIDVSPDRSHVYFARQSLRLRREHSSSLIGQAPAAWDLSLNASSGPNQDRATVEIKSYNSDFFSGSFGSERSGASDKGKDFLNSLVSAYGRSQSLVDTLFPFLQLSQISIRDDLMGGRVFDIIPAHVREYEDASSPPGIRADGSGLASTLYAIQVAPRTPRYRTFGSTVYDESMMDRILMHVQLANPTVKGISVEIDHFDNRLIPKVSIESDSNDDILLPLSAMSDGTLKWLAIVTAIVSSESIFAVEEVENHLHPAMQHAIVELVRSEQEASLDTSKGPRGAMLFSTHSESLLDAILPSEVVVVRMVKGRTCAARVSNLEELKSAISKTGFGLGKYYSTNSLESVNSAC